MGSVISAGCFIGARSMIAAGSVLLQGTLVPQGQLWAGNPAVYIRDIRPEEIDSFDKVLFFCIIFIIVIYLTYSLYLFLKLFIDGSQLFSVR